MTISPLRIDTKSVILSAALLIPLLLTSCGDSQVLAEFDSGKITRKDMRLFFSVVQPGQKQFPIELQDRALKNLALLRITAKDSAKLGSEKEAEFKKQTSLLDEWATVASYDLHLKNSIESRKFKMLEMQVLFLANGKGTPEEKDPNALRSEAETLVKKLNETGGADEIDTMISQRTDNLRYRPVAGYIDPHCISCGMNPLSFMTDPIKEVKEGTFVMVEDPQGRGFWIARGTAVREVKGKDLQTIFENYHKRASKMAAKYAESLGIKIGEAGPESAQESPVQKMTKEYIRSKEQIVELAKNQAEGQLQRESGGLLMSKVEELKQKKSLSLLSAAQPGSRVELKPETVLYTLEGKGFTFGMLKERLKEFEGITNDDTLSIMNNLLIPYALLKDEEDVNDVRKDYMYTYLKDLRRDEILAGLYFARETANIKVDDGEIKQWYDLRKFDQYKNKSYASVKEEIRAALTGQKKQDAFTKLQEKILKDHGLVVHSDLLKADKI
jgi:hypothetical protein